MNELWWVIGGAALFVVAALQALRALIAYGFREAEAILAEPDVRTEAINGLSVPQAIRLVEQLLHDPRRSDFDTSIAGEDVTLARLPRLAAEFFRQYGDVRIRSADSAAAVGPSYFHRTNEPDLVIIGGTEDCSIGLCPNDETVYALFAEAPERRDALAPTIYHWLLWEDPEFDPESPR